MTSLIFQTVFSKVYNTLDLDVKFLLLSINDKNKISNFGTSNCKSYQVWQFYIILYVLFTEQKQSQRFKIEEILVLQLCFFS